jgi:hypothetical protein
LFPIIDLIVIVLFTILTVYFLSVGFVLVRYYRKKNNNRQETLLPKNICLQCKKPYEKPKYVFEEVYSDEEETLIKSVAECPKCGAEIGSRLFSSARGEIE